MFVLKNSKHSKCCFVLSVSVLYFDLFRRLRRKLFLRLSVKSTNTEFTNNETSTSWWDAWIWKCPAIHVHIHTEAWDYYYKLTVYRPFTDSNYTSHRFSSGLTATSSFHPKFKLFLRSLCSMRPPYAPPLSQWVAKSHNSPVFQTNFLLCHSFVDCCFHLHTQVNLCEMVSVVNGNKHKSVARLRRKRLLIGCLSRNNQWPKGIATVRKKTKGHRIDPFLK